MPKRDFLKYLGFHTAVSTLSIMQEKQQPPAGKPISEKIDESVLYAQGMVDHSPKDREYWKGYLETITTAKEWLDDAQDLSAPASPIMEIAQANRLRRLEAQGNGYDDFCEAHQIPYNDECPDCSGVEQRQLAHDAGMSQDDFDRRRKQPAASPVEETAEEFEKWVKQMSAHPNPDESHGRQYGALAAYVKISESKPSPVIEIGERGEMPEDKPADCTRCSFWEVTSDFINHCKHAGGKYLPKVEKGTIPIPDWCPLNSIKDKVYFREECIFNYCPNADGCKKLNTCKSPALHPAPALIVGEREEEHLAVKSQKYIPSANVGTEAHPCDEYAAGLRKLLREAHGELAAANDRIKELQEWHDSHQ